MAVGTRMGEAFPRPGKKPTLPPPIPPRMLRRGYPLATSNDQRYVGSIVAVMATLNMEEICRFAPSELPHEIKWAAQALSEYEWAAIRREAIKAQRQFIGLTQGSYRQLRREEPWRLAEFLPTMCP